MLRVRFWHCIVFFMLLCVSGSAHAVNEQRLSLRHNQLNAVWRGFGTLKATSETGGLRLIGASSGYLLADVSFDALPQAGIVTTSADRDTEVYFVWVIQEKGASSVYAVPLVIPAGEDVRTPLTLNEYPLWRQKVSQVGFQLHDGQSILISDVTFDHWNLAERVIAYPLSFWHFNTYQPYSINFLWGPFLVDNAVEREFLYAFEHPIGVSGTFPAFIAIVVLLIGIALYQLLRVPLKPLRRLRTRWTAAVVLLVFWLSFDLRMGSEFLSWVAHDMRSYVFAAADARTFRDRDRFYDFVSFAAPFVRDRPQYVFFGVTPWPYVGSMRYATYPTLPTEDFQHNDTWVVYERPDLSVSPGKQIVVNGQIASLPGEVLGRFDQYSFVFRVHPPVTAGSSSSSSAPPAARTAQ